MDGDGVACGRLGWGVGLHCIEYLIAAQCSSQSRLQLQSWTLSLFQRSLQHNIPDLLAAYNRPFFSLLRLTGSHPVHSL